MKAIRLFLLMFLLPQCYVLAQYPSPAGPFNYSPYYEGYPNNSIAHRYVGAVGPLSGGGISFSLQELSYSIEQNDDCLMVSGQFNIFPDMDNNMPLVAFEYDTTRLLEIRYSDLTVIIKRYNHEKLIENQPSFYEYKLFDPLFIPKDNNGGNRLWSIQVYFTSNFMLIVTTDDLSLNTNRYYMSPVYFGLDFKNMLSKDSNGFTDNGSYMYKFLKKDEKAKIIVGDTQSPTIYMSGMINVYSLNYVNYPYDKTKRDSQDKRKNLWWHIQGNLSSPVDEPDN